MATMPSEDVQRNWWHISSVEAQQQPRPLSRNSMLLPRLLMQRNSKWSLLEVKRNLERVGLEKNNMAVQVRYRVTPPVGTNAGSTDNCTPVASGGYKSRTYMLDKRITQKMTLDLEKFKCEKESDVELTRAEFSDFWLGIMEQISYETEKLIYAHAGSNFAYIGKLPPFDSLGAPRPFDTLPLLEANGKTVNPTGLQSFMQDMDAVGAGDNYFAVGNTRALAYATALNMTVPNQSGYNVGALGTSLQSSKILNSYFVGGAFSDLGVNNPLVVIEEGALFFASAPLFNTAQATLGKGQKMFSMEHPNMKGVWVNITETISEVCEGDTLPTITWLGSVVFNIIGKMTCDIDGSFFNEGNNGVYLYDITCSDAGMCDLPNRTANVASNLLSFGKECAPVELCDADCTMFKLPIGYKEVLGETFAVFTVVFTPGAGGSQPSSFAWEINGTPALETSNSLMVNIDLLNNGDTITVTAADGAGCTAEATFNYEFPDVLRGVLQVKNTIGGAVLTSGVTLNLGDIVQNDLAGFSFLMTALNWDIAVSAIAASASATLFSPPIIPFTITTASLGESLSAALDTTVLGVISGSITITSDAVDEIFVINYTYTVIP